MTPCCWREAPEQPFDFFEKSPGRELDGLVFAMTFLPQQNRRIAGQPQRDEPQITADGKHVIVIGGGDTGSDCIGTSFRQGAKSVTQLEIMPKPPVKENKALSWPHWPLKLRVSSSQAEGAKTEYSISTTGFAGRNGKVEKLLYARVDASFKPIAGSAASCRPTLCYSPWGFPARWKATWWPSWASAWCRAGASRGLMPTNAIIASRVKPSCLPPATSGAARAWWCGPFARAGRRRTPSTAS